MNGPNDDDYDFADSGDDSSDDSGDNSNDCDWSEDVDYDADD